MIKEIIQSSIDLRQALLADDKLPEMLQAVADAMTATFATGGKVLFCGNGGSAADAQHLAAELSGRYYYDRPPLYAEALHTNTSFLTAVANDYSFDEVYARMVKAAGREGDVLVAISTSGNSPNIIKALLAATEAGMVTVGLTGNDGGKMKTLCSLLLTVPSNDTPRIQEVHIMLGHIICQFVESTLFPR
ncbi:MAG TPA: D-sedoheptulose 7-phosphate isomerase [Bacteroidales bacterium]|nr:D-sedoheptulose 7-phosphate isomerase [Bacteroidales bacterium]